METAHLVGLSAGGRDVSPIDRLLEHTAQASAFDGEADQQFLSLNLVRHTASLSR